MPVPNRTLAALSLSTACAGGLLCATLGTRLDVVLVAGIALLLALAAALSVSAEKLAFGAVAVLIFCINWNGLRLFGGAIGDVWMLIAFVAVALFVIRTKRTIPFPPWMLLAGIGPLVATLITSAFPPNYNLMDKVYLVYAQSLPYTVASPTTHLILARSNVSAVLKFELVFLLIPAILAVTATNRRRCVLLLELWAVSTIISAAVAVADIAGIAHLAPVAIQNHRSSGLALQPNYLGLSSVFGIPPTMLWIGRSRRWTIAGFCGVALLLGSLYASGSRAGAASGVLAVVTTVLAVPRLRRSAGVVLPLAAMVLTVMMLFTDAGRQILHQVRLGAGANTYGSDSARSLINRVSLQQFEARPLAGVGFGVVSFAHDIYVQLLASGGLITFTSFVVYFSGLFAFAGKAFRSSLGESARAAAVAILMWLVSGPVDNNLVDKFLYVLPGLLFAMSLVAAREHVGGPVEAQAEELAHRESLAEQLRPPPRPLPAGS